MNASALLIQAKVRSIMTVKEGNEI